LRYAGPQSEGLKRFDPPLKSGAIVPRLITSFIVPPFLDELMARTSALSDFSTPDKGLSNRVR
jgi:hypothetical protein